MRIFEIVFLLKGLIDEKPVCLSLVYRLLIKPPSLLKNKTMSITNPYRVVPSFQGIDKIIRIAQRRGPLRRHLGSSFGTFYRYLSLYRYFLLKDTFSSRKGKGERIVQFKGVCTPTLFEMVDPVIDRRLVNFNLTTFWKRLR